MQKDSILQGCKIPRIYAYTEPQYKNTKWENRAGYGYLKVGYTTRSVKERIKEQFGTNKPKENPYEILLDEVAIRKDGTFFTDKDVHKMLENMGAYRFKNSEWFECNLGELQEAIFAIKNHQSKATNARYDFAMRPEQKRAVEMTSEYFRKNSYAITGKVPSFLWNAKMRFGKTFTSYQLAKAMGYKKILVLTFKPAAMSAWKEDLQNHIDFIDWQFISKDGLQYKDIDSNKPFVWFASFQDVLGKSEMGGIKPRNESIHTLHFDCIILDEYHFGAHNARSKEFYDAKEYSETKEIAKENNDYIDYFDQDLMPLTTKSYLYLSGTPFRALNNGEFLEDQIFSWTYTDEQRAKANYKGEDNPYLELPKMVLLTYKMPEEMRQIALGGEFDEFCLNEFFRAENSNGKATFRYEREVINWLNLICGRYLPSIYYELKKGVKPPMPYADIRLLGALNHTLWFLPDVKSCEAMGVLLENHPFFRGYKIIVCAGKNIGSGVKAVHVVKEAIKSGFDSKTITLTCGKLTTGVTIKQWGGIFVLRDTQSKETYFQSIFRVQSPWVVKNIDGLNPNDKTIIKEICYVFDFAPDRALKQIASYSANLSIDTKESPEDRVDEFIHFLPVLCCDDFEMKMINSEELLDLAISGIASSMLAKKWESAILVNVDNPTLKRLLGNQRAMEAISKIEGFRNLNKDIATLVNKSEVLKDIKKATIPSKEEKSQLTKDEKEIKSKRDEIKKKLLKFATRIPIFMYLTDNREKSLKDIIIQIEPELFQKVTGLNISDFELLVGIGIFNEIAMNEAVFAFKRYEDASLNYTGILKHDEVMIGGWDTKIPKQDYINMIDYR